MFIVELTPELLGVENKIGDYAKLTQMISVRAIVWNDQNQIAIAHAKGTYYIPWGATDGGPLLPSIQREIREEVGANLKDIEYVGMVREYRMYNENGYLIENHFFSAKVDGPLQELQLTEQEMTEGHEIHWYSMPEAKDLFAKALLQAEDAHKITVLQRSLRALEEYTDMLDHKGHGKHHHADHSKAKEFEEIAKKAQYDYVMLKSEFDSYVRRIEGDAQESKLQQLIEVVQKLSPIIDQLGQSVEHIPEDLQENTWVAWVKLTYDNVLKILEQLSIRRIETIGKEPDMELHDPLSVEPTDDNAMKWKIIKEFSPGYVYEKNGVRKIVKAAKVIVGQ